MPEKITSNHHVKIGGIPASELAEHYGTPLYAYDGNQIYNNYRRLEKAVRKFFADFQIFYAIKACSNLAIANILTSAGAGIDAASPNEIRLASILRVPPLKMMFSGNNLSDADLDFAFKTGATINLDDASYLPRLLRIGVPPILSFRINPGHIEVSSNSSQLEFSGPQAKFGLHPDTVPYAYHEAKLCGVKRFGVHMMPYSNVLEPSTFAAAALALSRIVLPVVDELDIDLEFLDIGGGFGIPYSRAIDPLDLERTFSLLRQVLSAEFARYHRALPRLYLEPARYLVGDSGYLIGRILAKKDTYQTIIGTDISMNTFVRTVLYRDSHHLTVDGRDPGITKMVAIAGQICENTDLWEKKRALPAAVSVGDLLIVHDVGAYGYGMSYQYNGRLRPAEVLIHEGEHRLIRRAETFEDMIRGMEIPLSG
jgi:diaminopimelate decarboxylase